MKNEYATENRKTIESVVNTFSFDAKATAEELLQMHRTNQQTFTKLCVEWLKVLANMEPYQYDGRNEASHLIAKELLDGHDDLRGLPFV